MAKQTTSNLRSNEQIRITPVFVIDENGVKLGAMDTKEALFKARNVGLDLVEVAPNERPPVCKIMDYGKFKYQQKKHQRKQHEQQLKEVRLRPKTDDNDKEIKVNRALNFLKKGDKVQFTMMFRGRERAHREVGVAIFREIIEQLGDLVKVERPPTMDGRHMITVVTPNKAAFDKLAASAPIDAEKAAAEAEAAEAAEREEAAQEETAGQRDD